VLALGAWLVTDDRRSAAPARLAAEVARGMPCPSSASLRKYLTWMRASGLAPIGAEDLTQRVTPTWMYGTALTRRPAIRALLRVSDARLRRFAATFGLIHRAYAEGAMAYGMFTARKP
jgi:hypothetical protein